MISKALWTAAVLLLAVPAPAKVRVHTVVAELKGAEGARQLQLVRALGRSRSADAVEPLLKLFDIRKASPRLSSAVVEALGSLEDERAADALIGAWDYLSSVGLQMGSEMPAQLQTLRATVISALGSAGGAKASELLQRALDDQDPAVVQRAVEAFGRRRDKKAVEALIQLLPRGGNISQASLESLGEIGDKRAAAALERAMKSEDLMTRIPAAFAFARLGKQGKAGAEELSRVAEDRRLEVKGRVLAAHYLARLDERQGLDYLTALAQRGEGGDRLLALEALGKCRNPRAVMPLAEAVERSDAPQRILIARGLSQLGGGRAVAVLKRLAEDKSQAVRNAARLALTDLGEGF